jgi:hypothetical protein
MGYDFMVLRVHPRPQRLPSPPPESLDSSIQNFPDLGLIADALRSAGFVAEGESGQGAQSFRKVFDDEGRLYVSLRRDSLYIDTHAHWRDVGELYKAVSAVAPDALLFDPQKVMFHDAQSFHEFSDESYRKLKESGLR